MLIKQLSIFVENRTGRLAEIAGILADNNINLRSLSIADTSKFGVLRVIVDDPYAVEKLLSELGLAVSVTSVVSVKMTDQPGSLASVLKVLADNNINVEYMYAFKGNSGDAYVVMRVDNDLAAQDVLSKAGFKGYTEF
ncbi:MAG: ACT domain-containing protein [Clostridiales bacterium]|nr:ACT domain-containing protein [Clostridiales bacterium]